MDVFISFVWISSNGFQHKSNISLHFSWLWVWLVFYSLDLFEPSDLDVLGTVAVPSLIPIALKT